MGIKPLCYAPLPDGVLSGSEPKAVLARPGLRADPTLPGLMGIQPSPWAPAVFLLDVTGWLTDYQVALV